MTLYTLFFESYVPQDIRQKIASELESLHWEVERKWGAYEPLSNSFLLNALKITCWDESMPSLPPLPDGCLLEKS